MSSHRDAAATAVVSVIKKRQHIAIRLEIGQGEQLARAVVGVIGLDAITQGLAQEPAG